MYDILCVMYVPYVTCTYIRVRVFVMCDILHRWDQDVLNFEHVGNVDRIW